MLNIYFLCIISPNALLQSFISDDSIPFAKTEELVASCETISDFYAMDVGEMYST